MANSAQARKRARQAERHRQHNASRLSNMRTQVKNVIKAIVAGNKEGTINAYKLAVPVIDRSANRGLIHKNKAARFKSHLNARLKMM